MRKSTTFVLAAACVLLVATLVYVGCSSDPTSSSNLSSGRTMSAYEHWQKVAEPVAGSERNSVKYSMVLNVQSEPSRSTAIHSALQDRTVSFAHNWLSEQGYSYTDSNTVVFVLHRVEFIPREDLDKQSEATVAKLAPGDNMLRVVHEDTVVWQAFENPTHDMGNHTGVVTGWRDRGSKSTLLAELDVSDSLPTVIREGKFVDDEFQPGDVGVNGFFGCVGRGAGTGLFACALTNCAYLNCVGGVAVGSVVVCGIGSLFNLF